MVLDSGTIVDATILAGPSSAKSESKIWASETKQARKGNNWHSRREFQIGANRRGTLQSLTATHSEVSELHELPKLSYGAEIVLDEDQAYRKQVNREDFEAVPAIRSIDESREATTASRRYRKKIARSRARAARCEHPLRVVK